MRPGSLDNRVSVYRPSTTTNSYNETVEGYALVGKYWAAWKPGNGSERVQAEKVEGSIDGVFTFRQSTSTKLITHRYKITRANGEEYLVTGTPTYERSRSLYLMVPVRRVTHG